LLGHGAIAHQGSPQQPQQTFAVMGGQQIKPGPQIPPGPGGVLTPGLQLLQIQRKLQAIELNLQQLGRPDRLQR